MWYSMWLRKGGIWLGYRIGGGEEMLSSSLNIVSARSEVEEDIEVMEVEMIPEIGEELGCYHSVSVSWNFIKEYGVEKR